MDNINIRFARLEDKDELLRLGRAMHRESPNFYNLDFSNEKVGFTLDIALTDTIANIPIDEKRFIILVAEDFETGNLIGMLAITQVEYFFCMDSYWVDMVFFIEEKYRSTKRIAVLMLRKIEKTLKKIKSPNKTKLVLGVSTGINTEKVVKFYHKMKYNLYSVSVFKEI